MFRKFNKSRTVAILKSLSTSPLGICFYNMIIIFTIITIFYFIYLFNLYLINEKIISIFENNTIKSNAKAFLFIGVELFGLSIIISLLFIAYFVANDIIKCIMIQKNILKILKNMNVILFHGKNKNLTFLKLIINH